MTRLPPCPPTRRSFLGGALALGALPTDAAAAAPARLFAGTYRQEGGAGLVPLAAGRAGWQVRAAYANVRNASFGVTSRPHGRRYLLDEQQQGMLGVYDAAFRRVASHTTQGADPCHAALSPDGTMLAVANYSSGSVALWQLDPRTGLPQADAALIRHQGSGPNRERQASPHAHWVGFTANNRILHAVDLGADAIFAHHVEAGRLRDTTLAYRTDPGAGPRHLARHPRLPVAYLVTELANTVTILSARSDGTFVARGITSTLPAGVDRPSFAAHIAINRAGTRLYVSNRGHDSIAVFAIETDGTLHLLQHIPAGGHWPRFFLLREAKGEMLVANQRSGTITPLRIAADGSLQATGRSTAVPGVVFLTA